LHIDNIDAFALNLQHLRFKLCVIKQKRLLLMNPSQKIITLHRFRLGPQKQRNMGKLIINQHPLRIPNIGTDQMPRLINNKLHFQRHLLIEFKLFILVGLFGR
jgi:hypothetical protein